MKRWQAWSQSLQIVITTLQLEVSAYKISSEGFGNCLCEVKILLLVLLITMLSCMSESGEKLFITPNVYDMCANTNFKEDIIKYFHWIFFPVSVSKEIIQKAQQCIKNFLPSCNRIILFHKG